MKLSFEDKCSAIYSALRAALGEPYDGPTPWSVVATFEDAAVVRMGAALKKYPATFDAAGVVTLAEPVAVEITYDAIVSEGGGALVGPLTTKEGEPEGSRWAVILIEAGTSKNRNRYRGEVLRAAAPLYEGARCFWNHTSGSGDRDARDLAGFFSDAKFGVLEGKGARKREAVTATMNVTSKALREGLLESHRLGKPDMYGLSHDARAKTKLISLPEGAVRDVEEIEEVVSVDVVSHPAAGGRVVRLVAGNAVGIGEEDLQMFAQKLARLRESRPDLAARLSANPTEAEVDALLMEGLAPKPAPAQAPTPAPQPAPVAAPPTQVVGLTEADRSLLREGRVRSVMEGRNFGDLADLARETLTEQAQGDATVEALILTADRLVKKAAQLAEGKPASGSPGTTADIREDEADKTLEQVDAFFMGGATEKVKAEYKKAFGKDVPTNGTRSVKGLYEAITGDKDVTGHIREAKQLRRFNRLLEAIGSGTFAQLWGDGINRRMLAEYRAADEMYQSWRRVVSNNVPLSDFRSQERIRMGSFADLAIVPQLDPYPEMTNPTDEKVTYAPAKRGGIVSISREAIKNDDVGFIRQLPGKLAYAAVRTLNQFVWNLILTNPTLDDAVALFAASTSRGFSSAGNLIASALSTANISTARQRLSRVKDRDSNQVLNLMPKILVVSPENEELGFRMTHINVQPVSAQNATEDSYIKFMGLSELIVLGFMTDLTDWFVLADPKTIDTIEVGFVDGAEEPTLFVQDAPTEGSVFSADKVSWKARHEYGADVVEWRGMIGGIN